MIQRLTGIRYVLPLREGGSLPAVVETDRTGPYVVKFLGAGQGAKALIAEALAAGLALAVDLPVPEPAIVHLDEGFGKSEPHPEIQDILRGSVGCNFGLAYLPGALAYDTAVDYGLSPEFAANVVWFDAFITNVDRTPRNTNLLYWRNRPWLIDHGASLYIHHQWQDWQKRVDSPFPQIQDHVLLPVAGDLEAADARLRPRLTEDVIREIVSDLPEEWLIEDQQFDTIDEHRETYVTYLVTRLNGPRRWLQEAIDARERGPARFTQRVTRRVV